MYHQGRGQDRDPELHTQNTQAPNAQRPNHNTKTPERSNTRYTARVAVAGDARPAASSGSSARCERCAKSESASPWSNLVYAFGV